MAASATFDVAELGLESGTARRVEVGGIAVALVRIDDDVYAIGDICSHAHVSLSEGEVWCDEREIECPKHGSTFDLETGEPITLPATQPVPVFTAELADGTVTVTVDGGSA
jgi:3-phenylpropionate/trans-cinnamate dioxygenase ferredoxin subunit